MAESAKPRPEHVPRAFAFGDFEFDSTSGELRNRGTRIRLTPQCQSLLTILLENAGALVTRQELRARLWPNIFVEYERSLNRTVAKLRFRLNDDPENPTFIETIAGKGYRFIAPITLVLPRSHVPPGTSEAPVTPLREQPEDLLRAQVVPSWKRSVSWLSGAAAVAAGLILLIGHYASQKSQAPLTSSQPVTVLVAGFTNNTGDPVFDDTLKTGLDVTLGQSRMLTVLSDRAIADTLRLMTRPATSKLTAEVAAEVCLRAGCKASITGTVALLGRAYVVSLRAVDCHSGATLAEEQATALSREKVLEAVGDLASRVRARLGESVGSDPAFDVPLPRATTASLDALKAYSAGMKMRDDEVTQIHLLERATELDPNFALAYEALGQAYNNHFQSDAGNRLIAKAFQLREHTTEREKFSIAVEYYSIVTGQFEKAADIAEVWHRSYPDDVSAEHLLAGNYIWLGQFERALPYAESARKKHPNEVYDLITLLQVYLALNRIEEAKNVAAHIREVDPHSPHYFIYCLAFILGDTDFLRREAALIQQSDYPFERSVLIDSSAYYGRVDYVPPSSTRPLQAEAIARLQLEQALWEAEMGLTTQARAHAHASLSRSPSEAVRILGALSLARAGESSMAEALESRGFHSPPDSLNETYWEACVQAAMALSHRNPAKALQALTAASMVERSENTLMAGAPLYPAYLRGLAYLATNRAPEAVREFNKFAEYPGLTAACPLRSLARLQLARAYRMQGDMTKAKDAYREFFQLWKDADPKIPILQQARTEYTSF